MRHWCWLLVGVLLATCVASEQRWGNDDDTSAAVEPFTVDVPQSVLDDVLRRVRATRYPSHELAAAPTRRHGTPVALMRQLLEHWSTSYDWRSFEQQLNTLPHFVTNISGLRVHFLHYRRTCTSSSLPAIPLLFVHGWPGSFLECVKLAPLLADRFDLVCPSIPGYGFSGHPTADGFDQLEAGRLFAALMQRLGYARYALQGGDWGAFITSLLAAEDGGARVLGLHLNFMAVPPPLDPSAKGVWASIRTAGTLLLGRWLLDSDEYADAQRMLAEAFDESGYMHQQGTRPLTLGYALSDSPAGLAAWIVEKYALWSDCDGDVLARFSLDELINFVMIYWVNNAITPSVRFYYEFFHSPNQLAWRRMASLTVPVPTAFAKFPREFITSPRFVADTVYNIQRWTSMPRGGHFAALEEPQLLADDIRQFFLVDLNL